MGYQALLFCPDQKLARVVTQVFSELDFTVESVNEPFAAVKKLMAQRYDAVVVDCENEPNASLLFKSARNSTSNQSSLALALVEGQAGVAKAYRIGANLVLTKPINVEQAKGTLRVARGLLRKNLDAASTAGSTAPAKLAPAPAGSPFKPAGQSLESVAPGKNIYDPPEFESTPPGMAASAEIEESPITEAVPEAQTKFLAESEAPTQFASRASVYEPATAGTAPVKSSVSSHSSASGAAAAPAPAKDSPALPAEKRPAASRPAEHSDTSSAAFGPTSSPSFGALDDEDSGVSGGGKKILVAAAVLLALASFAYFGWTKLSKGNSGSPPVTSPQKPASSTSPAPTSTSPSEPSATESVPAASSMQSATAKPSATIAGSPGIKIGGESEPATKKPERAPIVVKSYTAAKKSLAQADDAALQVPNPLAVASPNDKNLSGLVMAGPAPLPKVMSTLKISQGVSQGLLIKRVQPKYPPNALAMRMQGAVQMEATINQEGNITNLKVVSGDPVLARAATDAVRQWRYKPYFLNGEPVEIQTQITVNFRLPN